MGRVMHASLLIVWATVFLQATNLCNKKKTAVMDDASQHSGALQIVYVDEGAMAQQRQTSGQCCFDPTQGHLCVAPASTAGLFGCIAPPRSSPAPVLHQFGDVALLVRKTLAYKLKSIPHCQQVHNLSLKRTCCAINDACACHIQSLRVDKL